MGQYRYQSSFVQTLHPTPRIENVGRRATSQQMIVTGEVDLPREIFTLRIRQVGEKPQEWVDLKIADNTAYGRLAKDVRSLCPKRRAQGAPRVDATWSAGSSGECP
jgi:hypothetical protein